MHQGHVSTGLRCLGRGQLLLFKRLCPLPAVDAGAAGGSVMVQTAPADGVVWGSMRQRVLQACHDLGVAVREESPSVLDRQAWREAFLTNRRVHCCCCSIFTTKFAHHVSGTGSASSGESLSIQ